MAATDSRDTWEIDYAISSRTKSIRQGKDRMTKLVMQNVRLMTKIKALGRDPVKELARCCSSDVAARMTPATAADGKQQEVDKVLERIVANRSKIAGTEKEIKKHLEEKIKLLKIFEARGGNVTKFAHQETATAERRREAAVTALAGVGYATTRPSLAPVVVISFPVRDVKLLRGYGWDEEMPDGVAVFTGCKFRFFDVTGKLKKECTVPRTSDDRAGITITDLRPGDSLRFTIQFDDLDRFSRRINERPFPTGDSVSVMINGRNALVQREYVGKGALWRETYIAEIP